MTRAAAMLVAVVYGLGCAGNPAPPRGEAGVGSAGPARDARPLSTVTSLDAGSARVEGADPAYRVAPVVAGGITVKVEWLDVPAALRMAPGLNACKVPRRPRLQVHTLGGVVGALVVVHVPRGRAMPPISDAPTELVVADCTLTPAIVVVPRVPATVLLRSSDPRRTSLSISPQPLPTTLASVLPPRADGKLIALPWAGSTAAWTLDEPSLLRVATSDDADDAAWVAVAGTPYVGVTDDTGAVELGDAPAGVYAVEAWLPAGAGDGARHVVGQVTVVDGIAATVTLQLGKTP